MGATAPQQPARGVKRDHEAVEATEFVPKPFEPVQMVRGCVVDVRGIPAHTNYWRVREMLEEFGKVKFVRMPAFPKASAKRARKEPSKKASEDVASKQPEASTTQETADGSAT